MRAEYSHSRDTVKYFDFRLLQEAIMNALDESKPKAKCIGSFISLILFGLAVSVFLVFPG